MKRVQQDTGQRVLFTGPDGIGDYRPRSDHFPRSIGIGLLSPDATSDLEYLFRPAPQATPPLPKHCYTGEVGWGLQYSSQLNRRTLIHNKQNEFDRFHSVADGVTHSKWKYSGWRGRFPLHVINNSTLAHRHTSPQFWDKQLPCTNHSTHDTHSEENNTKIQLNKGQSLSTEKDQTGGITFPQI